MVTGPANIINLFRNYYRALHLATADQLGNIYADDVIFIDPIASHHGLPAVERYLSSLLEQAESCYFDIHETIPDAIETRCTLTWTMRLTLCKPAKLILLNGISLIKISDQKIIFQRDYYDLGEMVYEHVPVMGWAIRKIKKRLAR